MLAMPILNIPHSSLQHKTRQDSFHIPHGARGLPSHRYRRYLHPWWIKSELYSDIKHSALHSRRICAFRHKTWTAQVLVVVCSDPAASGRRDCGSSGNNINMVANHLALSEKLKALPRLIYHGIKSSIDFYQTFFSMQCLSVEHCVCPGYLV